MTQQPLGVIAGTGFYDLPELSERESLVVDTAYGQAKCVAGLLHGRKTCLLYTSPSPRD